jgi:hypothetical protein
VPIARTAIGPVCSRFCKICARCVLENSYSLSRYDRAQDMLRR